MSKFTTMSMNQLRSEAKSAGFSGNNPKRSDLEAFLTEKTGSDVEHVGEITPLKVTTAKASKKVTITSTTSTDIATKRQYSTIGKTAVASRRSALAVAAKSCIENATAGMTQSKIFDAVCAETSSPLTATTWNDLSVVLKDFASKGIAQSEKGDKKRTLWIKA